MAELSAADVLHMVARFAEAFQRPQCSVSEFDAATLALGQLEPEQVRALAVELDSKYRGPEGQGVEQ